MLLKSIKKDEYLEHALSVLISKGLSYSRYPEHTNYYGYIFHHPQKGELKIPMKDLLDGIKTIPDIGIGFMNEDTMTLLPDYIADQHYQDEYYKLLIRLINKEC